MTKNYLVHSVDLIPWWLRDLIRKIPLISSLQRVIFNRYMSGNEFDYEISAGPAKGLNFPIKLPEDKLYWTGTWEKEISEMIYNNVIAGKVCYDIGSHRGFMAGVMGLAGASKVYCFEPNPDNIKHLRKLKELNKKLKLNILPLAVSAEDGEAQFSIMPESSMGKLSESTFQQDVLSNSTIKVGMRSLDSMWKNNEIETPGLIKIDVEGAENLVLQGAEELIQQYSPTFIIELHSFDLKNQCVQYLTDRGYNCKFIQKDIEASNESTFKVCHIVAKVNK